MAGRSRVRETLNCSSQKWWGECVFSLLKQKRRRKQQKYSLKDSVDENRPNPKKH